MADPISIKESRQYVALKVNISILDHINKWFIPLTTYSAIHDQTYNSFTNELQVVYTHIRVSTNHNKIYSYRNKNKPKTKMQKNKKQKQNLLGLKPYTMYIHS